MMLGLRIRQRLTGKQLLSYQLCEEVGRLLGLAVADRLPSRSS